MDEQTPRVVVGADASAESREAVRWAAGHARLLGARLEIVHAYQAPLAYRGTGLEAEAAAPELHEHGERLLADLRRDLEPQLAGLDVTTEMVAGQGAAEALIDRSPGAALLVVGPRGEGGILGGLHLGSVVFHCMQSAACPVVVVRSADSPPRVGRDG